MKKIILSSLVVLGLSTAAFAQAAAPDFASFDTDASGGLTLVEAQVAWPDLNEESFTAADTNADGELSVEEFDILAATTPPAVAG